VTASGEAEDGAPAPAAREVVVTACRGAHGCCGAPVVETLLAQASLVRLVRDAAATGQGSWELRAALEAAAAAVAMAGRSALPMARGYAGAPQRRPLLRLSPYDDESGREWGQAVAHVFLAEAVASN
jgi:hypothetical protein